MALQALISALRQHQKDKGVLPTLTPAELAKAWRIHPSSAYRVLERLREAHAVTRAGRGLNAEYGVTQAGLKKMAYLQELASFHEGLKKGRRAAANPEDRP